MNIRFIHVVRNPYDNITALAKEKAMSISRAVQFYSQLCKINQMIISRVDSSRIFELHHDDFIADPQLQFTRLCEYLGVSADKEYLEACALIVDPEIHKKESSADCPPEVTGEIKQLISEFEFLKR